ncbi:MAG: alcohol dehydrogenase catalytic domain-containing protein [Blastocatellia bacterium]|nr:alcohol dehydrogenase catalytic domain-containing protein [Blastocatellia bacterium]MCX7751295.1 alcohol dehydrogenase catalytic domain-containing protein [Blastocatellia bacterium]MDW8256766.1 alcohol dehydrogenase catalytic domain-containing protein [Acidobacteriota bacterium]
MRETMRAVVFRGEGEWRIESSPSPQLQAADEVLLKVERASICGTDLHILSIPPGHPATPGTILGHEYVATVVEVGSDVRHLHPGDRVVIDPNITCGICEYCRLGFSNMCENMTTLGIFRHGGLAEWNVAPAKALHKISAQVSADRATLAEPFSCVLHSFEKSAFVPGESVAILGAGPIGLMFLMLYKAAGAYPICVIEPAEFRRQMAESLGADVALDPTLYDASREIKRRTHLGADIVIDAVGTLLPEALRLVRRGGRIILFGMNAHAARELNQYEITRYEITILGSYIQRTAFPKVVRVLEGGLLPLERLVTHHVELEAIGEGFRLLRSGEAVKVAVVP